MADQPIQVRISEEFDACPTPVLRTEKIFSIQVGYKLFRLSGLSLSSDAPSYFTRFFSSEENADKVLFIDRNPKVFEKIYNHLQGYTLDIQDAYEMVHIWSDAYYFGLKRLQSFLVNEDIFAVVGSQSFKISRNLLMSSGNYPNYFTINYENTLVDKVKIIEQKNMLRPPPQLPPIVSNRSPKLFGELLEVMLGNHLIIQSDDHRQLLIRECKYYRFLELEQRIIKHSIINNPFSQNTQEIIINLKDLHYKGIFNESPPDKTLEVPLKYCRPYIVKEPRRNLIFQIDANYDILNRNYSEVKLILNKSVSIATVQITNKLCRKLLQVLKDFADEFITSDLDTDNPKVLFPVGLSDCKTLINGLEMKPTWVQDLLGLDEKEYLEIELFNKRLLEQSPKKRRLNNQLEGDIIEFKLTRSLWRVPMRGNLVRLHAVSIEGSTDQLAYNKMNIDFL